MPYASGTPILHVQLDGFLLWCILNSFSHSLWLLFFTVLKFFIFEDFASYLFSPPPPPPSPVKSYIVWVNERLCIPLAKLMSVFLLNKLFDQCFYTKTPVFVFKLQVMTCRSSFLTYTQSFIKEGFIEMIHFRPLKTEEHRNHSSILRSSKNKCKHLDLQFFMSIKKPIHGCK